MKVLSCQCVTDQIVNEMSMDLNLGKSHSGTDTVINFKSDGMKKYRVFCRGKTKICGSAYNECSAWHDHHIFRKTIGT